MSTETATPVTPTSPSGERARIVAAAVAVGAAALFLVVAIAVTRSGSGTAAGEGDAQSDADSWGGVLVEPADPRPRFTLTDTAGRPFDFAAETQGQLTLLFFGYTHCPDVCPVQMATLTAALQSPAMPDPAVVFVTTDPERDTPDRLREWLEGYDGGYVGLTGTVEEVQQAELAAGVPASAIMDGASGDYEVGHASQVTAYAPDDRAHLVYPFGIRREDWLSDLPRMMDEWGRSAE